jgi:hypothetical protein
MIGLTTAALMSMAAFAGTAGSHSSDKLDQNASSQDMNLEMHEQARQYMIRNTDRVEFSAFEARQPQEEAFSQDMNLEMHEQARQDMIRNTDQVEFSAFEPRQPLEEAFSQDMNLEMHEKARQDMMRNKD